MKIMRVYIENSVVGGYFDDEFEEATKRLFEEFREGVYKPVISTHVINELEDRAPKYVIDNLNSLNYEDYDITEEMIDLADKYMENNIVSKKYYVMDYILQ